MNRDVFGLVKAASTAVRALCPPLSSAALVCQMPQAMIDDSDGDDDGRLDLHSYICSMDFNLTPATHERQPIPPAAART